MEHFRKRYDICVIGGGHAGVEAAHIASQFGLDVALFVLPGVGLASAPCNPSIGGVGKGQVVRELDALGGIMGVLADSAGIQYRTLNESKGAAVHSTRVQIDKEIYSRNAELLISRISNIDVIREKVERVEVSAAQEKGFLLFTSSSAKDSFFAKKLIVTAGTFMSGTMHTGDVKTPGGRVGCDYSKGLTGIFGESKLFKARFKTGTPPRLSRESIDYTKLERQDSDPKTRNFHCIGSSTSRILEQRACYLAYTNDKTIEIIRQNKEKSPMFNGQITGIGARYCPSIEDKAYRYPEKSRHHVFIEPEGLNLDTVYPSGISTSLPLDIQSEYVRTIEGLESAEILIPGYAVEYDVVDTFLLDRTLSCKSIEGLYFAGQINGTSGYEEAAAQGLIAGANAALSVKRMEPLILSREDSYIGVMVEDLVTSNRDEPYRLFTARAENRLYLREDNTLLRMAKYRQKLGLKGELDRYISDFVTNFEILSGYCDDLWFTIERKVSEASGKSKEVRQSLSEIIRQNSDSPDEVLRAFLAENKFTVSDDLLIAVARTKKYEGYIKRAEFEASRVKNLEKKGINCDELVRSQNISFECRQRIARVRPETFGQLKLIDGIRPATLAIVAAGIY